MTRRTRGSTWRLSSHRRLATFDASREYVAEGSYNRRLFRSNIICIICSMTGESLPALLVSLTTATTAAWASTTFFLYRLRRQIWNHSNILVWNHSNAKISPIQKPSRGPTFLNPARRAHPSLFKLYESSGDEGASDISDGIILDRRFLHDWWHMHTQMSWRHYLPPKTHRLPSKWA